MREVGRSRSRQRVVAGAVILLVAVVLAAVVVLVTTLGRDDSDPSASPTAPPSVAPTSDSADASVCGLDGYEETDTLDQAPENDWELVGTVAAPTDPDGAGPGVVEGGVRSCFAHTAEGALFMAVNFAAMGTDASLRDRLPYLVVPGPGRDALLVAGSEESSSTFRAQVAGFKIASYTADEATIDLAVQYSSGDLVSVPMKLTWVEGDWKVQMTEEGRLPLSPAPLTTLGSYIPWSGA